MMDSISLRDKHILITGASSGIGRAFAILANAVGARLTLISRDTKRLSEMPQSAYVECDLADVTRCEEIVKNAVAELGPFDGFVHSAGIEMTVPLKILNPTHYQNVININTIAGFELAKVISKKNYFSVRGASFVFIASVMSVLGEAGKIAYCASKGALVSGARAMALELAKKNIRVNCISPGMVKTDMSLTLLESLPLDAREKIIAKHPLGIGEPEDVAHLGMFLLSDAAKWITGTNLLIDGGYSAT